MMIMPSTAANSRSFKKKGIPILEDCAYALGSRIEGAKVGTFGDYALYSLPKYFPMPFGGILAALSAIKHSGLELKATGENLVRQTIHASYPHLYKWNTLRRENWSRFNYDLAPSGFAPYLCFGDSRFGLRFFIKPSAEAAD